MSKVINRIQRSAAVFTRLFYILLLPLLLVTPLIPCLSYADTPDTGVAEHSVDPNIESVDADAAEPEIASAEEEEAYEYDAGMTARSTTNSNVVPLKWDYVHRGTSPTSWQDPDPVYSFTLSKPSIVAITAYQSSLFRFEISNKAGVKIWNESTYSGETERVHLNKGSYLITVDGNSGYAYSFMASTSSLPNESFEESQDGSNNTFVDASRIALDKAYWSIIAENDPIDTFEFILGSRTDLVVTGNTDINPDFAIYDVNHRAVWEPGWGFFSGYPGHGDVNFFETISLDKGTYYLKISGRRYLNRLETGWVEFAIKNASSSDGAQAMHRLYNPNSGEHFYTANTRERDNLVSLGWQAEGVAWNAPKTGDPVYRMYNPNAGDHHYTTSKTERDFLIRAGWNYEGVGWYSHISKQRPLYRLYNPNAITGAHHYTTNAGERDMLVGQGWMAEGIAWYGCS